MFQKPWPRRQTFEGWVGRAGQVDGPGVGGTLGISGWGCAARTLEPLAYTRASFSWILLPYTRVNSPNHSYPGVAEYGFSIFNPVSWSCHWPESLVTCWAMPSTYVHIIKTINCLILTSISTTYFHLISNFWQLIISSSVLW